MGCFACQTFWTAVAIYAITRGITDPAAWSFSAAAHSGAAALLSVLCGTGRQETLDPATRTAGCENCGK